MDKQLSRSDFIKAAGGAGAVAALGAYGGPAAAATSRLGATTTLSFLTWGGDSEIAAFKTLISRFEAANPGVEIKLELVPFSQILTSLDARLSAGQGPDIFRTTYGDIKGFAKNGGLKEFTQYVPKPRVYGRTFVPALWDSVVYRGRGWGVPLHTDVSAIVYNKDVFARAGIKVPTKRAEAWTWPQFLVVARKLKKTTGGAAFGMNWTNFGCFRWMTFLYQAGGQMITKGQPSLSSPAGLKTLAFFKQWKDEGFLTATNSPRGKSTYADFISGAIPMTFAGSFLVPYYRDDIGDKFRWGSTYHTRDKSEATEAGGTALCISKDSQNPRLAAKFLQFVVTPASERLFDSQTGVIPSLDRIDPKSITYTVRPDVMPVFVEQAKTLPRLFAQHTSIPNFQLVNQAMLVELEAFWNSGQSPKDTLARMDEAVAKVIKKS